MDEPLSKHFSVYHCPACRGELALASSTRAERLPCPFCDVLLERVPGESTDDPYRSDNAPKLALLCCSCGGLWKLFRGDALGDLWRNVTKIEESNAPEEKPLQFYQCEDCQKKLRF